MSRFLKNCIVRQTGQDGPAAGQAIRSGGFQILTMSRIKIGKYTVTAVFLAGIMLLGGFANRTDGTGAEKNAVSAPAVAAQDPQDTEEETEKLLPGEEETETEALSESPVTLYLDGEKWPGGVVSPDSEDDLWVFITLDGYLLAVLPFGEEHLLTISQITGEENHIRLTGEAVYMEDSTCDGQDCVQMGEVTRENLEMRVLGGFIICLPNRVAIEVREMS